MTYDWWDVWLGFLNGPMIFMQYIRIAPEIHVVLSTTGRGCLHKESNRFTAKEGTT